jgi:acetyl esterase/lipase
MLDDRTCLRKDHGITGEFVWTPGPNLFGWKALLGDIELGAEDTSYYIVPARAKDLSGLPPTYLQTADLVCDG